MLFHQLPYQPVLRADDVFLVSFPRSGNTWVRNIIAHLQYPHDRIGSLKDLDTLVPDIHKNIDDAFEYRRPRVIKTHRPFALRYGRSDKTLYSRIIYVVRHPFDVARSLYHYMSHKRTDLDWEEVLSAIVVGNSRWGSWQGNILSWMSVEDEREVLILRYEDLQTSPLEAISRISDFLQIATSPQDLAQVHERSSRQAMLALEQHGSIRAGDFQFVRQTDSRREIGADLTDDAKDLISEASRTGMKMFGYDPDRH